MSILKYIGLFVMGFIVLSIGVRLVFFLLGMMFGVVGLAIKIAVILGLGYLVFSGFRALSTR